MALLGSTSLYYNLPWLYLTLLHSTMSLLGSTSLFYTLPWLYFTLYYTPKAENYVKLKADKPKTNKRKQKAWARERDGGWGS